MQLRPIRADEVPVFAGLTGDARQIQQVQAYIEQMFAAGTMRPEWCFIAVDSDERTLGRVAFWTLPDNERPLDIVHFDVDWQSNAQSTGQAVLAQVLERARDLRAENLGYALDDPPSAPHFHHHLDERLALLQSAGFELARATYRFELPDDPSPAPAVQLKYRNLEEVGEAAFIEAIALVSEGSFDQRIAADRARLGAQEQARETLKDLASMEFKPEWWQLAYTPTDELVGLIMPASNFVYGVVGYVGVVPAQRGRGYIHTLLTKTTEVLRAAGYRNLRADTDLSNEPMANAFRRAGWRHFATRREMNISLK